MIQDASAAPRRFVGVEPLESRVLLASAGPRQMEYLDRGVVATRSSSTQVFVSWRSLVQDPAAMTFNVYRSTNGGTATKLNGSPLTGGTNFTDTTASSSAASYTYFVKPVVGGAEQAASGTYTLKLNTAVGPEFSIPIRTLPGYSIRHLSVGDLDGDGEYDYVIGRIPPSVNEVSTQPNIIEAYRRDGTFLWAADCGPNSFDQDNIEGGATTIDVGNWDGVTVYDLDGDGLAEVFARTANGFTFGDGATLSYPASNDIQFMSVLDGRTGAEKARIQIPTDFLADGPMAASFGIGYLDGVHPSLVAKMKNRVGDTNFNQMFVAYDYDGTNITQRWKYISAPVDSDNGHNIRIVDVDGDGKDEVADTAQVIDDDGTLLYNMRYGNVPLGHGDRFHIGDLDPDRPGLEGYAVQQNNPNFVTEAYWDAATGEILHAHYDTKLVDIGRGQVGDIDPNHRGYEYWSFYGIYNSGTPVAGQPPVETKIADEPNRPWPNFRIWWDGDVGSEDLNNTVINKWNPATQGNSRLTTLYHYGSPTATSGEAPIFYGDIFGDWREEVIFEQSDHQALNIYTTQYASSTRLYTLAQNPEYRNCMTVKGYLQSNMVDYYLGYGMTTPPAPNIQVSSKPNAPSIATKAAASPNLVTGTTANLSVLGADDGGEAALTYTWSVTGPAAGTIGSNGSNAAKNTTATFTAAGTYLFTVTARDAGGRTALSSVKVTVNQTLTTVQVAPASVAVATNSNRQFIATAYDQFGTAMSAQPAFTWSVISGDGTVNQTGVYTPPAAPGTATVRATTGALSATASITVSGPGPAAPASLSATTVSAGQINLSWSDTVSGEDGFVIERSTDGSLFVQIDTASANATRYNAAGLNANTTYSFRVRAYNANGAGVPSNVVTATTFVAPTAWWRMDESTGTTAVDSSGNMHDGITRKGPAWSAGRFGNALSFDGVDDYVELQNHLVTTAAGSVSMWIKTGTNFTDTPMLFYISAQAYGNGGGSEPELHVNFTSSEKLQLFIEGGSNDVNIASAASYADNAWHQVTATWDINGNAVLYVDGVQVNSAVHDANNFSASERTYLGRPTLDWATRYYKGLIDDVRLYDTAISAEQVQTLYNQAIAVAPTVYTGTAGNDVYYLKRNGSNLDIWVGNGGTGAPTYSAAYASIASLTFNGNAGDDVLTVDTSGGNPIPSGGVTFDGGADTDTFAAIGSSGADAFTFNATSSVVAGGASVAHPNVERRTVAGNGGSDQLTVNAGSVALAGALRTSALTVAAGATLDVKNFPIAVDYAPAETSPIAGLASQIATGRNGGTWTGSGIVTSSASGSLTSLGLAEAKDVLHLSGSQTALWNGLTVDATSVLVKYTYAGDADLNGRLDGDDYFLIDSHVNVAPLAGAPWRWYDGDFDYNGKINGDDYFLLDSNLGRQGVVL
jgi:hypothetical protein